MWDTESDVKLHSHSSGGQASAYGTTLWEFDGAQWNVKLNQPVDGGVVGEPPLLAGRFKGQLRTTPCLAPATSV